MYPQMRTFQALIEEQRAIQKRLSNKLAADDGEKKELEAAIVKSRQEENRLKERRTIQRVPENAFQSWSIGFHGDEGIDFVEYVLPERIESIVWKSQDRAESCRGCGSGESRFLIVKMDDGVLGYVEHWSGCMTYEPSQRESSIEYSPDMDDLVERCMTRRGRGLYRLDQTTCNSSRVEFKHTLDNYLFSFKVIRDAFDRIVIGGMFLLLPTLVNKIREWKYDSILEKTKLFDNCSGLACVHLLDIAPEFVKKPSFAVSDCLVFLHSCIVHTELLWIYLF